MHFAPIRFYKQTTLRTEAFTQSSFYAQIFLHREVSAQKTFVHKRLYTQRFLRKEGSIYTILHTDAVYKDAFARINKGNRRFYTPFPQRSFCTERFFTHVFSTKKHLTQRNLYTQTAHRSLDRPTFLHAETLPRTVFTQQKLFRTEAFTHKKKYAQLFLQTDGFYTNDSCMWISC